MDKITLIMFLGLSGFILFLFFYILNRDKVIENKLSGLELSLEELNKEIFKLKKEMEHFKGNSFRDIDKFIADIVKSIKKLEKNYSVRLENLERKLISVENNKKVFDFGNITQQEEEKIKVLYKNGYSVEEISRELRIPAGEIELILKFSNLI
jgi:predicted RNase H-like nuclease (RuvC/YqgF family)